VNQFLEDKPIQPPQKRTWYKRRHHPVLDALPSATAQLGKPMRAPRKKRVGLLRRLLGGIGLIVLLAALSIAGLAMFLREDRKSPICPFGR
jgi:hypothetical protein